VWKSIVQPSRQQMAIWCMLIACSIPVYKRILRTCNAYCFSTVRIVARKRLNVTSYVHSFFFCLFQKYSFNSLLESIAWDGRTSPPHSTLLKSWLGCKVTNFLFNFNMCLFRFSGIISNDTSYYTKLSPRIYSANFNWKYNLIVLSVYWGVS